MGMKTFNMKSLRGNDVGDGIRMSGGKFNCSCFDRTEVLCYGADPSVEEYRKVNVGKQGKQVFLRVSDAEPVSDQELVLVHEYAPGSGGKRWPSFWIDWENAGSVEKLASISRGKGSGADTWTLVIAPAGWAKNIASQFVNERDYGGQTISYKPGNTGKGKKESGLPQELLIAFRGDEEMTRKFVAKVAALPSDRLDDHVVHNCGRARVKAHLEEVSDDPDFFMGADPNRVVGYVAEIHFSSDKPAQGDNGNSSGNGGNTALGDALKRAGF